MIHASLGYGGSVASRTMACPGWIQLANTLPPQALASGGDAADRGNLCHDAMELLLLGKISKPASLLGLRYADQEMTQDLLDEAIYPALRMYQKHQARDWVDRWVEKEVTLLTPSHPGLCHGTADIIHRYTHHFDVSDWKFGRMPVKASSDQLFFYAAGAIDTLMGMDRLPLDHTVLLQVYQPALSDTPDVYETTVEGIAVWKQSYLAALRESSRLSPRRALCAECRYCPARPICPTLRGEVYSLAKDNPEVLSPTELGEMASKCPAAAGFISATHAELHAALVSGEVPGWKLIPGRRQRAWQDEKIAAEVLTTYLDNAIVRPVGMISPARAEGELRARGMDPDLILASLLVESRQRPRAVPEDDPAPSLGTDKIIGGLSSALSQLARK